MKKTIYLIISLFCFIRVEAQHVIINTMADDGQQNTLKLDAETKITCFIGKQVSDTNYLMWKVQNMSHSGTFILYSSDDGKVFKIIGTKKAIGVPVNNEIAYYMKDICLCELMKYYKVIYISETSEYLVSNKLMMQDEGKHQLKEI